MYYTLSLTDGEPIASIKGGKFDKFKFVRINSSDNEIDEPIKEFRFPDNSKLLPLSIRQTAGSNKDHPNRLYIGGASLCGKSYLAAKIAEDYQIQFPNNRIVIFSALDDDDNFDKLKNVYRVDCSDLADDPIPIGEFADTLCIFDDINSFSDKETVKAVNLLRDQLLSTGRHHNTDVISTAQVALDGKKSQQCIINNFGFVGFPKSGGRNHLINYCKTYMALDQDQIDKIIKLPSRWVYLNRVPPVYCLHEKGLFLLD